MGFRGLGGGGGKNGNMGGKLGGWVAYRLMCRSLCSSPQHNPYFLDWDILLISTTNLTSSDGFVVMMSAQCVTKNTAGNDLCIAALETRAFASAQLEMLMFSQGWVAKEEGKSCPPPGPLPLGSTSRHLVVGCTSEVQCLCLFKVWKQMENLSEIFQL